ncbi:MAG: 2-methylcitrate dehydratase PrpD [Glaciecola sp.]
MSSPTLVQQLGAFADATYTNGLPVEVATSTRQRVLDVIGLCLASVPLETSQGALDWVTSQGGAAQASLVGRKQRVPAAQAAFANGVLAHSLDYDDTHLPSILHPSASVVPAALAVGEAVGATGEQVLRAAAVGIEICVRLGMAGYDKDTRNSLFFERGQHATSICGGLAAAATAALLHGLGADGVANAIGMAASMSSGVIEANRTGGTVKRIHCGWAAHAGVTAAELVSHGFTGPPTVLEGRFGFYQAWIGGFRDDESLVGGLGTHWELPGIFFKPYPANHFTHAGIDAALSLRADGLEPDDVESVVLSVAPATARTIGEPIQSKREPESGYHAKFSGPYTVAAALTGGGGLGLGLDDFSDEAAQRSDRRALMQRIEVEGDESLLEIYPYQFPARLRVRTKDGSTLSRDVLTNRGGPDNPLTDDELATKFIENATVQVSPERALSMAEDVATMGSRVDVAGLLR